MKQKKLKNFLVLAAIAIYGSIILPARGDLIELKSGEIIKGKVISVNSKIVLIHKKPDKIKVNKSMVKQITFGDEVSNTHKEKAKPEVKVARKTDQKEKVKNTKATQEKAPQELKPVEPEHVTIKPDEDKPTPKLRPRVEVKNKADNEEPKTTPKLKPLMPANNNANSKTKLTLKTSPEARPKSTGPVIKINMPERVPAIDYVTYIKGSASSNTYLGIYSNTPEKNNLTIYLPSKNASKLSFNLHAQKNGKIPPLYTAASTVFIDKEGKIISQTNPIVVDKDNFVEWFKNLESVAGITGNKEISITIPSGTCAVEILGYRPASKENLVGYVSDIRIDGTLVQNLNKK